MTRPASIRSGPRHGRGRNRRDPHRSVTRGRERLAGLLFLDSSAVRGGGHRPVQAAVGDLSRAVRCYMFIECSWPALRRRGRAEQSGGPDGGECRHVPICDHIRRTEPYGLPWEGFVESDGIGRFHPAGRDDDIRRQPTTGFGFPDPIGPNQGLAPEDRHRADDTAGGDPATAPLPGRRSRDKPLSVCKKLDPGAEGR